MDRVTFFLGVFLLICVHEIQYGFLQDNYKTSSTEHTHQWQIVGSLLIILVLIAPCKIWAYACGRESNTGCLRVYSFCYWITFWISLIFVLSCSFTSACNGCSKLLEISRWLTLVMLPFLYLIIIIECAISEEKQYISNLVDAWSVEQYLEELRAKPPKIGWYIECYHYEYFHRMVTHHLSLVSNINSFYL